MSIQNKVAPSKRVVIRGLTKAARFQNLTQVEAVERAAKRRGWSVNAFIVRVAYAVAQRELGMPPVEVAGVPLEVLDRESAA